MGAFLSSAASKEQHQQWEHDEAPRPDSSKKMRLSTSLCSHGHPRLIPGLLDEISLQILARMPRMGYLKAKMVSRSWKVAITGAELYRLRKELGVAEEWLYILMKTADEQKLVWHAFDPVSNQWQRLPLVFGWGWLAGWAGQPPHMNTVLMNQPAVLLSHINEPATIRTSQPMAEAATHAWDQS